jgi:hypothetical protein
MVDFSDRDSVKHWLDAIKPAKRRRELAVALAARVALHAIPLLGRELANGKRSRPTVLSDFALPSLRAAALPWVVGKYPAHGRGFASSRHPPLPPPSQPRPRALPPLRPLSSLPLPPPSWPRTSLPPLPLPAALTPPPTRPPPLPPRTPPPVPPPLMPTPPPMPTSLMRITLAPNSWGLPFGRILSPATGQPKPGKI